MSLTLEQAYERVRKDSLFAFVYDGGNIFPVYDTQAPWNQLEIHLLPGSFNPIHAAHEALFRQMLVHHGDRAYCAYEMSMERIDKEFLEFEELESRLYQFIGNGPVFINRWPYFMQKAGILRQWNLTFHVGIDTAIRLVEAHGIAGIQGVRAEFVIYERQWENRVQGLDSCMVFTNRTPTNFSAGNTPEQSLTGLSSTAIRAGLMDRDGHLLSR